MDVLRQAVSAVTAEVAGVRFDVNERVHPQAPDDAGVTVQAGGRQHAFRLQIKRGILTPAALPSLETLAKRAGPGTSLMVVAGQIGPSVARLLQERNIAFMDSAGNAFLATPGLHVWISGKRSEVKRVVSGLHRPSAVKVIFALLADPGLDTAPGSALLNSPVRLLAKAANVATGSVGNVLCNLRSMGFLLVDDDARRLVDRERLIEQWVTDYAGILRHRLVHSRYRVASAHGWESLPPLQPDAWWSGDVAGTRLTRHLRPETMTIYARTLPDEWVVRAGLQTDPDGNVEVLTPFWGDGLTIRLQNNPAGLPSDCVHPLLVYADLLASGDERRLEAAKRLYDTYLRKLASSA